MGRKRHRWRGLDAYCLEQSIINETCLLLRKSLESAEISDGRPLRERLDAVDDLGTIPSSLRVDSIVSDDCKLAEGDEEKLLEARDRPCSRVT